MINDELELIALSLVGGVVSHFLVNSFEPTSIGHFLTYPLCMVITGRLIFSLTPSQILISLLAWLSGLGTSILIYRLVLPIHPLHHIPGPLFAKSTQLCQFYSLFKGRPRVDQRRLHERYGPVCRLGPNEVSIADTSALSAIFGAKSWQKGKGYSFTASGGASTSETALSAIRDHKEHTTRRKIWNRAFAIASLKGYQPSIELRVQQLCNKLDEISSNGPLDLQEWIGYLVFDVMTDLAWGGGGDALLEGRDPDGAIASLRYSLHLAGMTKALPWFASILIQFPWVERRTWKFRTFARDMFLRRKTQGEVAKSEVRRDVFYHLLGEGTSEGRQLSIDALQADSRQVVTYVF
jgi:cytochrome P450